LQKSKNRVTFDKNWNISSYAEYCHNPCSECQIIAHTHVQRRPRHSSAALSMMVWSMPCQTSVHQCCAPTTDRLAAGGDAPYLVGLADRVEVKTVLWPQIWWNECSKSRTVSDLPKFELLNFARWCSNTLKVWWEVSYGFCWKFSSFHQ